MGKQPKYFMVVFNFLLEQKFFIITFFFLTKIKYERKKTGQLNDDQFRRDNIQITGVLEKEKERKKYNGEEEIIYR